MSGLVSIVLKIIEHLTGIWKNKSDNQNISENNQRRENIKLVDESNSIVSEALKTKDLDKLRKDVS